MPQGKPAGIRCIQLTADFRCGIYSLPERPKVCAGLSPSESMCGKTRSQALAFLTRLEKATQ
jgi:uncharacterized protein